MRRSDCSRLSSRIHTLSFTVILLVLALSTLSFADEYHYINSLPGERAAGMGGAYTAVSDDPSGCFYNPAGIVFAIGRRLSISVNAYNISTKTYQNALYHPSGGGEDWKLSSSGLLPNFFGIVQRFGPGTIGFSYAVTDSTIRDQKQVFYNIKSAIPGVTIDRYVLNIDDIDRVYNIGPSYAIKLRDNLSVGTTLYLYYRNGKLIRNHLLNLSNGEFDWENYYLSWKQYGIKPILGFMYSPVEKISLGLTFSKNFLLSSETRYQITVRGPSSLGYGPNDVNFSVIESKKKRSFPLETKLGIAYFPSASLLISADVAYYTAVEEFERVVNGAIGVEYYLSPAFALRAGFFTDMANTPSLKEGATNQPEHINNYGTTLSLTYFTRNSSLTLGAVYTYGIGKAQVIPGSPAIQDARIDSLTVFVGAGYSY